MTPLQQIGANIKACRRRTGMTLDDLSEEFDVCPQAVAKWENGKSCVNAIQLHGLACCFGVSMDRFFKGVEWGDV